MASLNVKTGDTVVVITGKDAGKKGKVLKVSPKTKRIVVEGVNIVSKAHKARSAQDKSEIRKIEGTIDISNVMPVCPKCGKPTRVHHQVVDGKKVRVCKCGASLDVASVKAAAKAKKAVKTEDTAAVEPPVAEEKPATKTAAKKTTTAKTTKTTAKAETSVKATKASAVKKSTTTGKSAQRGV